MVNSLLGVVHLASWLFKPCTGRLGRSRIRSRDRSRMSHTSRTGSLGPRQKRSSSGTLVRSLGRRRSLVRSSGMGSSYGSCS